MAESKTIKDNICFIHIPKCGGTSIRSSMKKSWINQLLNRKVSLNHIASSKAADSLGKDVLAFREDLLRYYLFDTKAKFVFGHFRCTADTRDLFQNQWTFVTLIRDPVKRWLSHYFFDKFRQKNIDYNKTNLELEEYLHSQEGLRNAHMYLRHYTSYQPGDPANDNLVQEAVENIRNFDVFGVLEDMPSFASTYRQHTGTSLKIITSNKNPKKGYDKDKISASLMQKIEEINQYDIKIYQQVKDILKVDKP